MWVISITDFLEVLHQFLTEGITWSSGLAIVLAILKIRDSQHKRRVNEKTQRDIAAIKEHLGIWNGQSEISQTGATNSKPSSRLLQAVTYQVNQLKLGRKKKMNKVNWVTLTVAILGAVKLILQSMGIDIITDQVIDVSSNLVAGVVTLVGIFLTHRKPNKEVANNVANNDTYDYSGIDAERESAG